MPACTLQCSDTFDDRRFKPEVVALLRALLASTATEDMEPTILYDVEADGSYTAFYRIITQECDGTLVITDFELDGTTPYTPSPTGTIYATPPLVTVNVVNHSVEVTGTTLVPGSYTIPAGFIHGSIAVDDGSADIEGVTYLQRFSLNLPPMSFGGIDRLYPQFVVDNVVGRVIIYYATKV